MWRTEYRLQAWLFGSMLIVYPPVFYSVQYSNRYVIAICFAIFLPAGFALHRMYLALRRTAGGYGADESQPISQPGSTRPRSRPVLQ